MGSRNDSSSHTVRVGLVQSRCAATPEDNLRAALDGVRRAARKGAGLVCLQELFRTRYFCQVEDAELFDLAETVPGPTSEALASSARENNVALVGSVFERRDAGVYHNTALVFDADGALLGRYRKMHIPDEPLYHEKFYFTPGDTGFVSFETRVARIGPLVCWDQWFPEAARLTALRGAQILLYPTAIGFEEDEEEHGSDQREAWEVVQRGHAIANGVFVAAVNRVGREEGLEFWGASFVCDPLGRMLARASRTEEEVLVVDCDLALVEETRRGWPFLRDRRVDAYEGLTSRLLDGAP
ncbi:MAG: carbon-nitrogen hydrolase [Planctomycetota bacterium]|nr:carbon-nitrogen hydrolase [Planctomycetota bacterium]